jgi:hypothetical protein
VTNYWQIDIILKWFVHRSSLCSLLLLVGIALISVSAKNECLFGDANSDGVVNAMDIVEILSFINGNPSEKFDADLADINGDGNIDVDDVNQIADIIMGKTETKTRSIDTIRVVYQNDDVRISDTFRPQHIQTTIRETTRLSIVSKWKRPFVLIAEGTCSEGSLIVEADTTCTLILDNLELSSSKSTPICFLQKQKVNIELPKGSNSILSDAISRNEDEESLNGCLYSKGALTFSGKGTLKVTGNYRHGIVSSKSISVDGCHLIVENVVKDGIHCDKFTLKKGQINLNLQNAASKGIKVKEELIVKGGTIGGEASGGITIEEGDVSYCALLKSDGKMSVSDGTIVLKHLGEGGRCISVDKNMDIMGGTLSLECLGDGGKYINKDDEEDYYTPKCITVDDSIFINSGTITCLSTGLGGKGIVSGRFMSIGSEQKEENSVVPIIKVDTKGECIINNENEDLRFGCPKGIKADSTLIIYDGDIAVNTAGMGGEGIECNKEMFIKGGTLECNTYDDGINVGKSIEISGGQVYCNSVDNDGIDSNGSITISGGIVASVNQNKPNESLDSEGGQLSLLGGIVFGIGSGSVEVKISAYPCYSTPYDRFGDGPWDRGLILTEGKYVYVQKNGKAVMALRNDNKAIRSFLTIMYPSFSENEQYTISEGESPQNANQILWDKLYIDCVPNNDYPIAEIRVQTII